MYSYDAYMPVRQRIDLRHRLAALARAQAGYFTAAQARAVGYSYASQRYHVQRGNWVRVDRALFRMRDWPVTGDEELVRWSLWAGGKAIVSHDTALSLHEIGDANPSRVHLTVPAGFRKRSDSVVLHVADIDDADVLEATGYRVTAPLKTLLDVAASDMDGDQLRTAIEDAVVRGLVVERDLRARAHELGARAELRIERALAADAE